MADKKISQLTAATLPLAGTELLPIVQSGTTDNITVNNLAAGNVKSNATTGVLQVTGPAAASTRVMTTPDANFTVARTDAAQTLAGLQTLSAGSTSIATAAGATQYFTASGDTTKYSGTWYDGSTVYNSFFGRVPTTLSGVHDGVGFVTITAGVPTLKMFFSSTDIKINGGNLVIGTSGKGIDFSASTDTGTGTVTGEILSDYEEGTWVPTITGSTSSAGITYAGGGIFGTYTRIGRVVYVTFDVNLSSKGTASGSVRISSLPFTSATTGFAGPSGSFGILNDMALTRYSAVSSVSSNSTDISILMQKVIAPVNPNTYTALDMTEIGNNFRVAGSLFYFI